MAHKKWYFQMAQRVGIRVLSENRKPVYRSLLLMLTIPLLGVIVASLQPKSLNPVYASSHKEQEGGAVLFHEKGCEYCHGVDGVGTNKAPDLSTIGTMWKKSQIKRQILDGGHEMPPFRDALQPDEVKALVDYLSAKREVRDNP